MMPGVQLRDRETLNYSLDLQQLHKVVLSGYLRQLLMDSVDVNVRYTSENNFIMVNN